MSWIADSATLAEFCQRAAAASFVTVDTEFMRERTYWAQLCLVQCSTPDEAVAIDALAPGIDLSPLFRLLEDPRVLKVFHAARQDLEIFHHMTGKVPGPLFDTQVAAMVCGFGDAVSYETLAGQLAQVRIDKSARFTDWAQRPLSDRQITYALADVIHLKKIYLTLAQRLTATNRASWLQEEMATLLDPATYRMDPEEGWRRFKPRTAKPRLLAVLKEVAAWREREAQRRDVPRNRVIRDETVMDIAGHAPGSIEELARVRGLSRSFADGRLGEDLLAAVRRGLALPESEIPVLPPQVDLPPGLGPVVELLKVILKMKCEEHGVATKLVASTADLERIAADDDAPVPALHGWRREVFGEAALALKRGEIALTLRGRKMQMLSVKAPEPAKRPAVASGT
ncbi:MAG TPA: ribonuclease D [Alphaproteobacteria bacterium]|nr:ribonuclease D [Alphaproteobacteria bacterium]